LSADHESSPAGKKVGVRPWLLHVLLFSALVLLAFRMFPPLHHWTEYFQPAGNYFMFLRSPYNVDGFFNPPWVMAILGPLALLPVRLGQAIICAMTIYAYGYTAHRLGARPPLVAFFLLSPFVLYTFMNVNLDWMVSLGLVLPPQIGLFFLLVKPQIGGPIVLLILIDSIRKGGLRRAVRVFLPVTAVTALSVLLYGPWFIRSFDLTDAGHNLTSWPYALPAGLGLLYVGLKRSSRTTVVLSGPLVSPYIGQSSFPILALGMLPDQVAAALVVVGFWFIQLLGSQPDLQPLLLAFSNLFN